ncbi:DUF1376 domain-containing protein [Brevundimonas sp.]|uniref:DUF1376 domain-containing protein n=1 Tax=Brevundimonas sp. TaxID=1871086 RepID=UPI002D2DF806|nr:DUF1376 domain-containing protein [Brevundimonas sp.]HYC98488.1 DUF1376 domain-containing protein [Brevundimonas sp.]
MTATPITKLGHAKTRPWHKRWHGNALNGYRPLSLEERGAYTTFLDTMYDQGGPIRDNKWNLANILGTDPRVTSRLRTRLIETGKLVAVADDDGEWLVNDRVQQELGLPTSDLLTPDLGRTLPIATADVTDSALQNANENSKSAEAGGSKSASKKKRIEKETPTPSGSGVSEAVRVWNEAAVRAGLPRCLGLNDKREKSIAARLADHGPDGWAKAVQAVERSRFCCGENDRKWKAGIDYVASPAGFLKLIEGTWAADRETSGPAIVVDIEDVWRERLARHRESNGRFWKSADWGPRPGEEGCTVPPALLAERGEAA